MTLPKGWIETTFGKVANVIGGGTPPSKDPTNFTEIDGIAWITPADLSSHKAIYISRGKRNLSQKGYEGSSAKLMPKGTVLFSSRAPIGYIAIAENVISTNQGFKSFVLYGDIDNRYIYYYLHNIKHIAERVATGTTFKELSGTKAKHLPLLLPPLNEQERIAEKLEQLLARVDKVKEKLEGVGEHIIKLKLSILTQATYGKLVGKGVYKDWQQFAFEEICTKITDGTHHSPKSYEHGKYEYVTAKNIRPWGLDLSNITYVEQDVYATIYKRCPVEKGDVLYIKDGATTGLAIVNPLERPFAMLSSVALLKPKHDVVLGPFLAMVLNSPWFKQRALGKMSGSAIRRLVLRQIKAFEIYLPPLEEQHEIVHRVEHLLTLADTLEQHYQQAKQKVDKLTAAILAKAFRGQLVPQDPNDESAEKLLERIQAERQAQQEKEKAAKKAKRKRKKAL